jgi:hypothetical protein
MKEREFNQLYDTKNDTDGEMFIRYENPNKTLKYQLFEDKNENPTLVDVKFKPFLQKGLKLHGMFILRNFRFGEELKISGQKTVLLKTSKVWQILKIFRE